jgi:hypothetical protein
LQCALDDLEIEETLAAFREDRDGEMRFVNDIEVFVEKGNPYSAPQPRIKGVMLRSKNSENVLILFLIVAILRIIAMTNEEVYFEAKKKQIETIDKMVESGAMTREQGDQAIEAIDRQMEFMNGPVGWVITIATTLIFGFIVFLLITLMVSGLATGSVHATTVSIEEAVDNLDLTWTTGGNVAWSGQTTVYYYDGDSAQSGKISHSQNSWLSTTIDAGTSGASLDHAIEEQNRQIARERKAMVSTGDRSAKIRTYNFPQRG